jgi:hypothetical protein
MFVTLPEGTFLLDTGGLTSFGRVSSLVLDERRFNLPASTGFLSADTLSGYVGRHTDGLLGTDILNKLDIILDVPRSRVCFSTATVNYEGERLPLDFSVKIRLLTAGIDEMPMKLFLIPGCSCPIFRGQSLSYCPC